MNSYGERLSDDQVRWADAYLADPKRVRRRYAKAFESDEVLKDLTTADETLARFQRSTAIQWGLRWPQVQHQRIPVPHAVLGRVYAFQNRQRVKELERAHAGRSLGSNRGAVAAAVRAPTRRGTQGRNEDRDRILSR